MINLSAHQVRADMIVKLLASSHISMEERAFLNSILPLATLSTLQERSLNIIVGRVLRQILPN